MPVVKNCGIVNIEFLHLSSPLSWVHPLLLLYILTLLYFSPSLPHPPPPRLLPSYMTSFITCCSYLDLSLPLWHDLFGFVLKIRFDISPLLCANDLATGGQLSLNRDPVRVNCSGVWVSGTLSKYLRGSEKCHVNCQLARVQWSCGSRFWF